MPEANGATILVVDDVETNRYVVGTWLRRAGYVVVEAATGAEALDAVDRADVDLVTLDVRLPDMSGLDVCERIKGDPRTAALPILHLSATAVETSDRSEGLRRGADGYLVEPVEPEELLATIGALLRYSAARRHAVRLAAQLRRMHAATLDVGAATTPEELLAAAAGGAGTIFATPAVVVAAVGERSLVALATPDRRAQVLSCAAGLPAEVADAVAGRGALAADALPHLPVEIEPGDHLAAPLTDRAGAHLGAVLVPSTAPRSSEETAEVLLILEQFAHAVGISVENLRAYGLEHQIAVVLQHSLLPANPARPPGVEVAARYEAAAVHAEVGGDFYELLELDDERVVAAVGDVVGHSLQAATIMAELRNGLRAYALDGHGPTAILQRLDRLLRRFHRTITSTVCLAFIDRRRRQLTVANAGHPPPLLLAPGGPRYLRDHGPLLGLGLPPPEPVTVDLEPGSTVLLVTDGLFERQDESVDEGLGRLARAAAGWDGELDQLCDHLLREVGPGAEASDDVALLAVRLTPMPRQDDEGPQRRAES